MHRVRPRNRAAWLPWYSNPNLVLNDVYPSRIDNFVTQQYYNSTTGVTAFPYATVRTNNGTHFDAAGNLVWGPANMLLRSQEFDSATWAASMGGAEAPVVPNNATAPDGTLTADTITFSAPTNIRRQALSAVTGQSYTYSVWVRQAASGSATHTRITTNNTAAWNTGGSTRVALTSSWQRISVTWTQVTNTSMYLILGAVDVAGAQDTTCYGAVEYWGAQLELTDATAPKAYTATTTATFFGPRFDTNPDTLVSRGLLVEEARTNDVPNGANAPTGTNATVAAGSSYLGNWAFHRVTSNGASAAHSAAWGNLTPGATQARRASIVARMITGTRLQVTVDTAYAASDVYVNVNMSTGAIVGSGAGASNILVETLAPNVRRISFDYTSIGVPAAGAGLIVAFITADADVRLPTNSSADVVDVDFAQNEAGQGWSSIMPTVGVATARGADTVAQATAAWFNTALGTIFADYEPSNSVNVARRVATISDGSANNLYSLVRSTTRQNQIITVAASVSDVGPTNTVPTNDFTPLRSVGLFSTPNKRTVWSGGAVNAASVAFPNTGLNTLRLGSDMAGANHLNGWLREFRYYPAANATDVQLQGLSYIGYPVRGQVVTEWREPTAGTPAASSLYPDVTSVRPPTPQGLGPGGQMIAKAVTATESSVFNNFGFWFVANPRVDGQPYSYFQLGLGTDSGMANRAQSAFTARADGVPRFIVLPRRQWGTNGIFTIGTTTFSHVRLIEIGTATALTLASGLSAGATSATLAAGFGGTTGVNTVRFSNNEVRNCYIANGSTTFSWDVPLTSAATTAAVRSDVRLAHQSGDSFRAGTIWRDCIGRAAAIVSFDDCTADQFTARQTLSTDFVGTSGVTIPASVPQSALSILNAFGLKGTAYILTENVGQTALNFMSVANLQTLQNTHGWSIAINAGTNPLSALNRGYNLLGPLGFNLSTAFGGGVASVDTSADTITMNAAHNILTITGNAGGQAMSIQFFGTNLPAPLNTTTRYYIRSTTTTAFTLHLTLADAVNNTNRVDLTTTGTPANFGYRYWGSTLDETGTYNDLVAAQTAMQGWGLTGWRHWALNQGAYDTVVERAALRLKAEGRLQTTRGTFGASGSLNASWIPRPIWSHTAAGIGFIGDGQNNTTVGNWITIPTSLQTEGVTEANIRTAVDNAVDNGGVLSNYHHFFSGEASLRQLCAYCDQLKLRQDQGLVDVLTVEQLWARMSGFGVD